MSEFYVAHQYIASSILALQNKASKRLQFALAQKMPTSLAAIEQRNVSYYFSVSNIDTTWPPSSSEIHRTVFLSVILIQLITYHLVSIARMIINGAYAKKGGTVALIL